MLEHHSQTVNLFRILQSKSSLARCSVALAMSRLGSAVYVPIAIASRFRPLILVQCKVRTNGALNQHVAKIHNADVKPAEKLGQPSCARRLEATSQSRDLEGTEVQAANCLAGYYVKLMADYDAYMAVKDAKKKHDDDDAASKTARTMATKEHEAVSKTACTMAMKKQNAASKDARTLATKHDKAVGKVPHGLEKTGTKRVREASEVVANEDDDGVFMTFRIRLDGVKVKRQRNTAK